ncbi:hypothetical protein CEXT_468711, partial [Caerostris extrusa]
HDRSLMSRDLKKESAESQDSHRATLRILERNQRYIVQYLCTGSVHSPEQYSTSVSRGISTYVLSLFIIQYSIVPLGPGAADVFVSHFSARPSCPSGQLLMSNNGRFRSEKLVDHESL